MVHASEQPQYVDMDVTLFDMTGISENANSKSMIREERKKVLEELIPSVYLHDYQQYAEDVYLMKRIHRHRWADKLVWLVERSLFKVEKWKNRMKKQQKWG